jgi:hypothetical protein
MGNILSLTLYILAALVGALAAAVLALIAGLASANTRDGNTSAAMTVVAIGWLVTFVLSLGLTLHGLRLIGALVAVLPLITLVGMFLYTSFVVERRG